MSDLDHTKLRNEKRPMRCYVVCGVVLLGLIAPTRMLAADKNPDQDWVMLFDGKSTDAWRGYKQADFPREAWIVDQNTLRTNPEHPIDLITREQYENFELELEWKVAKSANSGIMYHVSEDFSDTYWTGPEMQVVDDDNSDDGKEPKTSSGSLYALIAPTNKKLNPAGNWNKARLIVLGTHVEYWLNDRKIVEYELGSPELKVLIAGSKFKDWPKFAKNKSGHIALQNHGGTTWYRNIRLRVLKPGLNESPK